VFCGEQLLVSYLRPSKIDGAQRAPPSPTRTSSATPRAPCARPDTPRVCCPRHADKQWG
jgi:hypothetical protein